MNPQTKDLEMMEEHNDKCFKDGILKQYDVKITVEINGKSEVYIKSFVHNTLDQTATLWNDETALYISQKVEELIKENNMLF